MTCKCEYNARTGAVISACGAHAQYARQWANAEMQPLHTQIKRAEEWFKEIIAACEIRIMETDSPGKRATLEYLKTTAEQGLKVCRGH